MLGLGLDSSTFIIVGGIALVLYIYVWFHNTEMAMNITTALFKVIFAIGKGIVTVIINVVSWIVNAFSRLFK